MIPKKDGMANLDNSKLVQELEAIIDKKIGAWRGDSIYFEVESKFNKNILDIIVKKYTAGGWTVSIGTGCRGEGYGEYDYYTLSIH